MENLFKDNGKPQIKGQKSEGDEMGQVVASLGSHAASYSPPLCQIPVL